MGREAKYFQNDKHFMLYNILQEMLNEIIALSRSTNNIWNKKLYNENLKIN